MKGIRIVEQKFIIYYLLKIISVSVYCNIIRNKIFSHIRIIVHKMTAYFSCCGIILRFEWKHQFKRKKISKFTVYIIDRPKKHYFLGDLR